MLLCSSPVASRILALSLSLSICFKLSLSLCSVQRRPSGFSLVTCFLQGSIIHLLLSRLKHSSNPNLDFEISLRLFLSLSHFKAQTCNQITSRLKPALDQPCSRSPFMAPQHRGGFGGRGRLASGFNSPSPYPLGRNTTRAPIYPSAFRVAFQNAMKGDADDEKLGPVLSGRKKLIVAKLAEEGVERKVKGEAKKEKHLIEERGHVEPANFLDSREKFLIGVATKGVVKLFYAVNKAQNAQKGLNPSRFKDAKALTKRSKEAFFSELIRASGQSVEETTKASASEGAEDNSQPAWAPLQDTFMSTNSKLKDWDKMAVEQSDI